MGILHLLHGKNIHAYHLTVVENGNDLSNDEKRVDPFSNMMLSLFGWTNFMESI